MLIFSSSIGAIKETKRTPCDKFDMKDLGEADVILGIKVTKTEKGYLLSQSHYMEKLLKRPDLAFAVNKLSWYAHNPGIPHWDTLRRVLQYLRGTIDWGLNYKGNPAVLEGFCDANWVNELMM
ncbi:PREDICTED: uncharacterized protein LOC109174061 [Ipomoea nil]|uniref:uncharacterized protein LOC109174061 n=1 Tax=Ipomoea nil TaxID=35883 RepID=UPI0009009242|nr:PREDICTED: uncharacterized protein LOC109174061 [Ipomoea nil]